MPEAELMLFEKLNVSDTKKSIVLRSCELPKAADLNDGRELPSLLKTLGYDVIKEGYATNKRRFVRGKGDCSTSYTKEWHSRGLHICYGSENFWPSYLRFCICASKGREEEVYRIAKEMERQMTESARGYVEKNPSERKNILKMMPTLQAQVARS